MEQDWPVRRAQITRAKGTLETEPNSAAARWGNWRSVRSHQRDDWLEPKRVLNLRWEKLASDYFVENYEFRDSRGRFRLFLLFSSRLDLLAQLTGMGAVESGPDSLAKRSIARALDQHTGPGNRLQNDPVPAEADKQGENEKQATEVMETALQGGQRFKGET
jgi:hypothetical protein